MATINDATGNAFDRAGSLLGMTEGEIRARSTFTGGVEIARQPGVVQLSMLVPEAEIGHEELFGFVTKHYK
ncbi:hypothetical protein K0C01_12045 [Salinarchaeum sp. IM2453]|uniref:hypothetical protein n=1 Tax=Salinarchaeum sp. IM2453 TaxID=2862870 RepID=UPI001C83382B|nr:hypothetical protein [Salinarchaeum sp. IM2453]QZA88494.1 hypothetical protein K0C01_12045 [Salinarchaeum sp. IM2453]